MSLVWPGRLGCVCGDLMWAGLIKVPSVDIVALVMLFGTNSVINNSGSNRSPVLEYFELISKHD